MYAIIEADGKQYQVSVGDKVKVDKIAKSIGDRVELNKVLLISDDQKLNVGHPYISNAKVISEIIEQGRDKKIYGFKYKKRKKYRKTWGHRQYYTELEIKEIISK